MRYTLVKVAALIALSNYVDGQQRLRSGPRGGRVDRSRNVHGHPQKRGLQVPDFLGKADKNKEPDDDEDAGSIDEEAGSMPTKSKDSKKSMQSKKDEKNKVEKDGDDDDDSSDDSGDNSGGKGSGDDDDNNEMTSAPVEIVPTAPVLSTTDAPTPAPSTEAPTAAPITEAPTTAAPTSMPSNPSPSAFPSIYVMEGEIFLNEIGQISEDEGFVEIAYSSYLPIDEFPYLHSISFYFGDGTVYETVEVPEGENSAGELTYTVVEFPNVSRGREVLAFALVEELTGDILSFVSIATVVLAVEGPADGMSSTDLSNSVGRRLEDAPEDSSLGLVGEGCSSDDFEFSDVESTPGEVNVNQTITGCPDPFMPSAAPSEVPTTFPTTESESNTITNGSIAGMAIAGAMFFILCVCICIDRRLSRGPVNDQRPRTAPVVPPVTDIGDDVKTAPVGVKKASNKKDDASVADYSVASEGTTVSVKRLVVGGFGGGSAKVDEEPEESENALVDGQTSRKNRRFVSPFGFVGRLARSRTATPDSDEDEHIPKASPALSTNLISSDPASIALSRKEDVVSDEALTSADIVSDSLEKLDAALDKHDWTNIKDLISVLNQTESKTAAASQQRSLPTVGDNFEESAEDLKIQGSKSMEELLPDDHEEPNRQVDSSAWEARQVELTKSIQRMTSEIQGGEEKQQEPSTFDLTCERELESLIAARDWEGLAAYVNIAEKRTKESLKSIEVRSINLGSDLEKSAHNTIKAEFEAISMRKSAKDVSGSPETDKRSEASNFLKFW